MHLFPDIEFDYAKFGHGMFHTPRSSSPYLLQHLFAANFIHILFVAAHWSDKMNQRRFFIEFAKRNSINPHLPQDWYSCTLGDIRKSTVWSLLISLAKLNLNIEQGGGAIAKHYNGSISEALIQLFPELHLEKSKFKFTNATCMWG